MQAKTCYSYIQEYSKIYIEIKATRIVKRIFKKKNKVGDLIYMFVRPIM